MKIQIVSVLIVCFAVSSAPAKTASIGFFWGPGSYSTSNYSMNTYGAGLSVRGEKPGELAVGYLSSQVALPANTSMQLTIWDLELRHRFGEKIGPYIGLPLTYVGSSNENIISSGMNIGAILGIDMNVTERFSIGIHGQAIFIRNFYQALVTFKLWSAG